MKANAIVCWILFVIVMVCGEMRGEVCPIGNREYVTRTDLAGEIGRGMYLKMHGSNGELQDVVLGLSVRDLTNVVMTSVEISFTTERYDPSEWTYYVQIGGLFGSSHFPPGQYYLDSFTSGGVGILLEWGFEDFINPPDDRIFSSFFTRLMVCPSEFYLDSMSYETFFRQDDFTLTFQWRGTFGEGPEADSAGRMFIPEPVTLGMLSFILFSAGLLRKGKRY